MGKSIKVEAIRDHPKKGRVKVPERMVAYVVGSVNRRTLRRIARLEGSSSSSSSSNNNNNNKKKMEKKKAPRGGGGGGGAQHLRRLNSDQQAELLRAARRGFVTLEGTGFRRGRSSNALACAHRQLCDEQDHPQMVLCKASGGRPLDCLVVDLSPLRLVDNEDGPETTQAVWATWKEQILSAAQNAGMTLRRDYQEDNCYTLSTPDDDDNEEPVQKNEEEHEKAEQKMVLVSKTNLAASGEGQEESPVWEHMTPADAAAATHASMESDKVGSVERTTTTPTALSVLTDKVAWSSESIERLPSLSVGVFEGERSCAKAMARELVNLWDTAHEPLDLLLDMEDDDHHSSASSTSQKRKKGNAGGNHGGGHGNSRYHNQSSKNKRGSRKDSHRRQRRNNQRDLNMYLR